MSFKNSIRKCQCISARRIFIRAYVLVLLFIALAMAPNKADAAIWTLWVCYTCENGYCGCFGSCLSNGPPDPNFVTECYSVAYSNAEYGCEDEGGLASFRIYTCYDCYGHEPSEGCLDECPENPDKVEPGICGCDEPDVDDDNDGYPNCIDQCPWDPGRVCDCDEPDPDLDGDGIPDCIDKCVNDANHICDCNFPDTDQDSDGIVDCLDGCPSNPWKRTPGECGCNVLDIDTDGDGTYDCDDNCPDDPNKTEPGCCGCGEPETDSDIDGTPDCIDGCPDNPNRICGCNDTDIDNDKLGDSCDDDRDGDNCLNWIDNCPNYYNPVRCAEEEDDCVTNENELHTIIDWWLNGPWSFSEANGIVVFEAEHYTKNHPGSGPAGGSMWLRGKDPNASSGQYMVAMPDRDLNLGRNYIELYSPYLVYEVNFITPSTYYLWIKGAAVNDMANTIWFGIDGQLLHNALIYSGVNFGWLSELFYSGMRPTIYIPEGGIYQVVIWMDDDGAKLDQFALTVDPNYVPISPDETLGFPTERQNADYNRDGNVNFFDFAILANHWLEGQ